MLLEIVMIVVLLFLSGVVSGSEVAFFSLTPNDYEDMETTGSPTDKILLKIRETPRMLLATILIANNFINIAIVLVSEILLRQLFPQELFVRWANGILSIAPWLGSRVSETGLADGIGFAITVIGVTFLLVLFGEVAPKVYASYNKVKLAHTMARPVNLLMNLFRPLAYVLVQGAGTIEKRLESHRIDAVTASQEDIDEAIELTVNKDDAESEELRRDADILKRIVQFSNVTVRQIMRSRGDVVSVEQDTDYAGLLAIIRESGYSRIPVYEEDFDKIKGLLYVKDLLGYRHEPADFDWRQLVRTEVLFVPETKKINDLLAEFQARQMHLAIVVDEFGGSEGIVTLEDVLEEVIGDIHDEFDTEVDVVYQRIDNLNYVFEGKTLLGDFCRVLKLPSTTFVSVKGEAESIAGLVLEILGRLPEMDEEIEHEGYRLRVAAVTPRRIEQVHITLPESAEEEESAGGRPADSLPAG